LIFYGLEPILQQNEDYDTLLQTGFRMVETVCENWMDDYAVRSVAESFSVNVPGLRKTLIGEFDCFIYLANQIERSANSGNFSPHETGFGCGECAYRDRCKKWRTFRMIKFLQISDSLQCFYNRFGTVWIDLN